jgi:hypothetical protein
MGVLPETLIEKRIYSPEAFPPPEAIAKYQYNSERNSRYLCKFHKKSIINFTYKFRVKRENQYNAITKSEVLWPYGVVTMDAIEKYKKSDEKIRLKRHNPPWTLNDTTVLHIINDTVETESMESCDGHSQYLVSLNSEAHHRMAAR